MTDSVSSTSCKRSGHAALANAQHAADNLREALNEQKKTGDGDQCLERKDRDASRTENAHFAEANGHFSVLVTGIHEGQHGRQEEDDVEQKIHLRLCARLPEAVEHVGANMAVARQRIGAGHQKQRAIIDVAEVEGPGRRRAEDIAHQHFITDAERQNEDQPSEALADPEAERVDEEQKFFHVLRSPRSGSSPRCHFIARSGGVNHAALSVTNLTGNADQILRTPGK